MAPDADLPLLPFARPEDWHAWLAAKHADAPAVLVQFAKKGTGIPSITWEQAVEVALAWGWIDGVRRAVDDQWYSVRFSPRRARSVWSRKNVATAERLIAEERMQAPGLAQVESARADGRWERAYAQSSGEIPTELATALAASPTAQAAWDALDSRNRFAIVFRTQSGKREATRLANAAKFTAMLERGERLYP